MRIASAGAPVRLSVAAMATRFELALHGDDPVRLRAAGEEALAEIERLDAQLSFYGAWSEIRGINVRAAERPVRVEPRLFRLLQRCAQLSEWTDGAFDVTVGPLMRAWRFTGSSGAVPSEQELEAARAQTGIHLVELDAAAHTVRFRRPGVELDLGGYGKGYAIERALELLRENGVAGALLHGGTSSVGTLGAPPGCSGWRVRLGEPLSTARRPLVVDLAGESLSVSAVHGKSFTAAGRVFGHVIDPRTGEPASTAWAAAVAGTTPSVCEALSTALVVLGRSWLPTLSERFPGYRGFVPPATDSLFSSAQKGSAGPGWVTAAP